MIFQKNRIIKKIGLQKFEFLNVPLGQINAH